MRRLWGGIALVAAALAAGAACGSSEEEAASPAAPARAAYGFSPAISNLSAPVHVAAPRGERGRLYVVEQGGRIRVFQNGRLREQPFLDITSRVQSGGEQGLLSVAFHPRYAQNRKLYVNYTDTNGDTRVVEFRSNGETVPVGTARQLLFVRQPYPNHNGGQIAFGPDGLLYVGMGDGGAGGDPENRAQNLSSLLGKLLTINVDRRGARPQIAALGLRNPWRFSFDRANGDLYIGDVGQNAWEEIDWVRRASRGAENYGWDVFEGRARYEDKARNPRGRLISPVFVYGRGDGCSVTGGFVYRGSAVPAARGRYFFGDYCSGQIWSLRIANGRAVQARKESFRVPDLASFGEDAAGELYAVSISGTVYRFRR
jgi:glucose/arabinose dehydrogenase